MARFAITAEARQRLQKTDPRWRSKAILRAAAVFLDFIALILFALSVRMTLKWESQFNGGAGDDWTDGMPLAPVLLSFLYNSTVLFLLLRHRRGRPYHPGWDVAFDLIIWALSVPSIVFSVGDGWWWWWEPVEYEIEPFDIIPCSYEYDWNFWSEPCQPSIYTIGKIEIAANVFLALILIIHFTLFVMACIATRKWRREAKSTKTERRNIELQYHRSPEEHKARQPEPLRNADIDKDIEAGTGSVGLKDIEARGGIPAVKYA